MNPVTKKCAFAHLLRIGKWALRAKYSPQNARLIERAFKDEPAEIIAIAARDLSNAIRSEQARAGKAGRGKL